MKKLAIAILIAMMTVSVSACGSNKKVETKSTANKEVSVEKDNKKEDTQGSKEEDKKQEDKKQEDKKQDNQNKDENKKETDTQKTKDNEQDKKQTSENSISNLDEQLTNYIVNNVPEVKNLKTSLGNNKSKMSIYIERKPDGKSKNKYYKDYYGVYVGQALPDHNVNIYRFAINKDTKDVVFYDVMGDEFMSLDQWRKSPIYKI